MRKTSKTTSLRLTEEGKRLLDAMALKLGVTQAAIFELALRNLAEWAGVQKTPRETDGQ